MSISITLTCNGLMLPIKVYPNKQPEGILPFSVKSPYVRLNINAKAENNQANQRLIKVLAKALSINPQDIKISTGAQQPNKQVFIAHPQPQTLLGPLAQALNALPDICFTLSSPLSP